MNINRLLGNHQPFKRGQPVYCTWAKDLRRIYKVFHRNELTKLPDNSLFDFKKGRHSFDDDDSEYFYVIIEGLISKSNPRGISHNELLRELWRVENYDVQDYWGIKYCDRQFNIKMNKYIPNPNFDPY